MRPVLANLGTSPEAPSADSGRPAALLARSPLLLRQLHQTPELHQRPRAVVHLQTQDADHVRLHGPAHLAGGRIVAEDRERGRGQLTSRWGNTGTASGTSPANSACLRPSHKPSISHTAAIGTAAKAMPVRPRPSAARPAYVHAAI